MEGVSVIEPERATGIEAVDVNDATVGATTPVAVSGAAHLGLAAATAT